MNSKLSNSIENPCTPEGQIHVLLVDYDDVHTESIRRVLRELPNRKYHIDDANNFEQAEILLTNSHYDICLIDYHLNDRTGLELLESINRQNLTPGVILLASSDQESIDQEAMAAGASDFISKNDITPKLLERAIRYAIHHKQLGRERDYLSHHDSLTGLVSRTLFFNRLVHQIEKSSRHHRESAVLYLDVDSFKSINDVYGHGFGDSVLKLLAERLISTVRSCDTVARLGGDEFAILLEDIDKGNAHFVCQKLLKSLEKHFVVNESSLYVSASMGMTCFRNTNLDATQIVKQADQALHFAKKEGKKTYRHFSKSMRKAIEEDLSLEYDFVNAVDTGQILTHYQPKYSLRNNQLVGFEALARWPHPTKGMIPPSRFIPCAEKLSLTSIFTGIILDRSCEEHAILSKNFGNCLMSVNVSATDCASKSLVHMVEKVLKKYNLDPRNLELEVTETVLMKHPNRAGKMLGIIHDAGVRIAIDDFGKGYSSLSYLTELPIDTLKIDMEFVQGIGVSPQKESVIQVIIQLAKSLGFEVVAEGVETIEQLMFLKEHDCDQVQGYYYSKPLSLEQCMNLDKIGDPQ